MRTFQGRLAHWAVSVTVLMPCDSCYDLVGLSLSSVNITDFRPLSATNSHQHIPPTRRYSERPARLSEEVRSHSFIHSLLPACPPASSEKLLC